MKSYVIDHSEYSGDKIIYSDVDDKKTQPKIDKSKPDEQPKVHKYQTKDMNYEYSHELPDGTTQPVHSRFLVRLCPMTCTHGISVKTEDGYTKGSILATFDMTNPEVTPLFDDGHDGSPKGFFYKLHNDISHELFKDRSKLDGYQRMTSPELVSALMPFPIHMQIDPQTNRLRSGTNPRNWFQLKYFQKFDKKPDGTKVPVGKPSMTPFQVPIGDEEGNYQEIPWSTLENMCFDFIPTVHIQRIFNGSVGTRIKMFIHSAIITDIRPVNNNSVNKQRLDEMSKNSALVNKLKSQLAVLNAENKLLSIKKKEDSSSMTGLLAIEDRSEEKNDDKPVEATTNSLLGLPEPTPAPSSIPDPEPKAPQVAAPQAIPTGPNVGLTPMQAPQVAAPQVIPTGPNAGLTPMQAPQIGMSNVLEMMAGNV